MRGFPPKDGKIPRRAQIQAAAEREEEQGEPQCGAAGGRSITREEDRKENRKRAWHHHREQRGLQKELHVLSSYTAEDPDRAVDSSAYSPVGARSDGFPPAGRESPGPDR